MRGAVILFLSATSATADVLDRKIPPSRFSKAHLDRVIEEIGHATGTKIVVAWDSLDFDPAQSRIDAYFNGCQLRAALRQLLPPIQPATKRSASSDPLAAHVAELDLQTVTLEEAINRLCNLTHSQILVDWKSLESAGIDRNSAVNLRVGNVSLSTALSVILEIVTGGQTKLAFRAEESGIIRVSTAEMLAKEGMTRVYNIRDLIERLHVYDKVRNPRQQASRQDAVDAITKSIEDMVDTDTWKDNGGSTGSLREFAGLLIVNATPETHQKLKVFLEKMRGQLESGAGK